MPDSMQIVLLVVFSFFLSFLSAILFDNIVPNGSLPRHVVYRIRMNGQLMTSTRKIRSRNWYPGPNHNYLSYYYYGYVWLQDQLERAISEVLVGRNIISPGLYIQEMPYPCYLEDQYVLSPLFQIIKG